MLAAASLPAASKPEQRRCAALQEQLQAVLAHGPIGFDRFMEMALYQPELGYYMAAPEFDARGDFLTAVELTPLMAAALAQLCHPYLCTADASLLEYGPGSGRLSRQLLTALAALNALPKTLMLCEKSPALRQKQEQNLLPLCQQYGCELQFVSQTPAGFRGVILGHELIDAFPVQRWQKGRDCIHEIALQSQHGKLLDCLRPAAAELSAAVAAWEVDYQRPFPLGYRSEYCPAATTWIQQQSAALEQGLLLLIDYGEKRPLYHADHYHQGHLRCCYRHRLHGDPLLLPGLQDISCAVNFSQLIQAGQDAGLYDVQFDEQSTWLLHSDLPAIFESRWQASNDEKQRLLLAQQCRQLLLPQQRGRVFKWLAFTRQAEQLQQA